MNFDHSQNFSGWSDELNKVLISFLKNISPCWYKGSSKDIHIRCWYSSVAESDHRYQGTSQPKRVYVDRQRYWGRLWCLEMISYMAMDTVYSEIYFLNHNSHDHQIEELSSNKWGLKIFVILWPYYLQNGAGNEICPNQFFINRQGPKAPVISYFSIIVWTPFTVSCYEAHLLQNLSSCAFWYALWYTWIVLGCNLFCCSNSVAANESCKQPFVSFIHQHFPTTIILIASFNAAKLLLSKHQRYCWMREVCHISRFRELKASLLLIQSH